MGVYGSKPDNSKLTCEGKSGRLRVNVSSTKGWRRKMEDVFDVQFNVLPGLQMIELFDGHGGSEVAEFSKAVVTDLVKKNEKVAEGKLAEAIEEVFLEIDRAIATPEGKQLMEKVHKGPANARQNGCSATLLLVKDDHFVLGSVGKCTVWMVNRGQEPKLISILHGCQDKEEKERIKAAGGWISEGRVNDSLTMTRALGILDFKHNIKLDQKSQILTAVPDVQTHLVDDTLEFIMMGSDGTFELITPQKAAEQIRKAIAKGESVQSSLNCIIDSAIAKDTLTAEGCNNMTIITVCFQAEPVSVDTLTFGQVKATVQTPTETPTLKKKPTKGEHPDVENARFSHDHGI